MLLVNGFGANGERQLDLDAVMVLPAAPDGREAAWLGFRVEGSVVERELRRGSEPARDADVNRELGWRGKLQA